MKPLLTVTETLLNHILSSRIVVYFFNIVQLVL